MTDRLHIPGLSRRQFLALSALGATAAWQHTWAGALAGVATTRPAPRACILLWMSGGPSQMDTWDPKTDSPDGFRGPFDAIDTTVPGMRLGAVFPNLARLARHLAVIRTISSVEVDHPRACYHIHTGYRQRSGGLDYPGMGNVIARKLGDPAAALPGYIYFKDGGPALGTGAGYLGADCEPLRVMGKGLIANASSPLPARDFARQVDLLSSLNDRFLANHPSPAARDQARTLQRAVTLMTSDKLDAFDISKEPAAMIDAYGGSALGAACLRARRLVEVGVPFVEIHAPEWDHHSDLKGGLNGIAWEFDKAAAALITDLHQRGLLERTLVIMTGEFGRTPKLSDGKGRDHFAKVWSAALAGGGVRGGIVVGKTDDTGAEVVDRPLTVVNLISTIYTALGIDPLSTFPSPGGRPVVLVDSQNFDPQPIHEIVGVAKKA